MFFTGLHKKRARRWACECRSVTGKTKVSLEVKITIPWMELVAAINSVRLAHKVKKL